MTEVAKNLFVVWLIGTGLSTAMVIYSQVDLSDLEPSRFKRIMTLILTCVGWFVFFPKAIRDYLRGQE